MVDQINEEEMSDEDKAIEREKARAKLGQNLSKTNKDLMAMKADKLNMLIKKKYYDSGKEMPEEDMFQFHFSETSDGYQFTMPISILFGRRTQAFCAQYWDDFFKGAGIDVSFTDNIKQALEDAGNIHLTMTLDKEMDDEVDKLADEDGEEEPEAEGDGEEMDDDLDIEDDEGVEPDQDEEFNFEEIANGKRTL